MDSFAPAPARTPSRFMHLLATEEEDERHELVAEIVHALGFDWLSYGVMRRGGGGPEMLDPWRSLGAERWQRRYRDHGYQRVDPRMSAALVSRLPVVWEIDTLRRDCAPSGGRFIDDLGDTGMRTGVMLALAGDHPDERTVVSLLTRDRDPGLAGDDTRIGHAVTLGLCLREMQAQAATQNTVPSPLADAPAPSPLNPTQQAILQYLAGGLCDKQIAARLALSLHTVDYHMRQLRKRYGARNRVQLAQAASGPPTVHSELE